MDMTPEATTAQERPNLDETGLYISAIVVPSQSPFGWKAIHDPYWLHRLVTSGFANSQAATEARVLFRYDVEGDVGFVYVQTKSPPDWSRLPEALHGSAMLPIPLTIPEGPRLRFRLLAKPSFRVGNKESPNRGRRITLGSEAHQIGWLMRKGKEGGFLLEDCVVTQVVWNDSKDKPGNGKDLMGALFEGVLVVTDRAKLVETVANGVGPNKAFGFGLLSLAPME